VNLVTLWRGWSGSHGMRVDNSLAVQSEPKVLSISNPIILSSMSRAIGPKSTLHWTGKGISKIDLMNDYSRDQLILSYFHMGKNNI